MTEDRRPFESRFVEVFDRYLAAGIEDATADVDQVVDRAMSAGRPTARLMTILAVAGTITATAVLTVVLLGLPAASPGAQPQILPTYARDSSGPSMMARLEGQLVLEGGCVLVEGEPALLAWPSPGTEWDSATQTVTVYGTKARIGDWVVIGGGTGTDTGGWVAPPAVGCKRDTVWIVESIRVVPSPTPSP